MEEFDQSAFRVWPNPARETVQLSIPPDLIGARLVITDAQGRVLQRARATRAQRTSFTIDTPGVYFVSLLTDSGHAVQRVVVE
ncbi:MAG: T9SS type A sorting domain-containing protein [Flavobacteriales bacterium]|nr:T9SS type A sorting domain-containing protein [Flavobacteriales bacterium]